MNEIKLAVIQSDFGKNQQENIDKISQLMEKASNEKAKIICTPELFEFPYFPREKNREFFQLAKPYVNNKTLHHFQALAKKLEVALPISFFEKSGDHYFNSLALIDDKGINLGLYRKTFIPSGSGYEEKFYFEPGDTGFKVWETSFGKIGVGICWDQWFPESARAVTLMGADLLLYPTCIGSEPDDPTFDTKDLWQRVMIGHSVANIIAIAAANRIGTEGDQTYYGSSFISDHRGNILAQASRNQEEILYASFDIEKIRSDRKTFGLLKDLKRWKKNKENASN